MPILSVKTDNIGQSGQVPQFVYIQTNDTTDAVTAAGYLNSIIAEGIPLKTSYMALVTTSSTPNAVPTTGLYTISVSSENWSLVVYPA